MEIASATKYGLLERNDGKIRPTELARRILRPTSTGDQVRGCREGVLKAPDISDVYKHYRGENIPDDETFFAIGLLTRTTYPKPITPTSRESFMNLWRRLTSFRSTKPVFSMFPRRFHIQKKKLELRNLGQKLPSELGKRAL